MQLWGRYVSLGFQKEMQLCLDGGREGRLLSHLWEEGSGGMWGCPQLSWPRTMYPSPGALPSPISGLFPVGHGEDDSAPTEGREAKPAQGAQGRAGSQAGSGTEQAGVFVLCPMSQSVGGGGHPRASQEGPELPGRSWVRLSGAAGMLRRGRGGGRSWAPFPLKGSRAAGSPWARSRARQDNRTFSPSKMETIGTLTLQRGLSLGHSTSKRRATQVKGPLLWGRCPGEAQCCHQPLHSHLTRPFYKYFSRSQVSAQ